MTRLSHQHADRQHGKHIGIPEGGQDLRRMRTAVKTRDVACPDCKAPPGEPCINTDGTAIVKWTHKSRQRIAIRQAQGQVDTTSCRFVEALTPKQRLGLRRRAGATQVGIAALFGVDGDIIRSMENGERKVHDTAFAAYGALLRLWATKDSA